MKPRDEREVEARDRRLIEAIRAELQPAPMSPARRAAFRAALEERLARRGRSRPWRVAAFAATAAAAAALWWLGPAQAPVVPSSNDASALYAFVDPAGHSTGLTDDTGYLPDDYLAIARLIEAEPAEP